MKLDTKKNKLIILILIILLQIPIFYLGYNILSKKEIKSDIDKLPKDLKLMSDYEIQAPTPVLDKKVLKVLIVEIDPIMIQGVILGESCAGKTASSCLKQDKETVINELIDDIESSSHGIIDIQIVDTNKLNEFSTNKTKATLIDGTKSNKLDENTWLDIMKDGWYGFWDNEIVKEYGSYVFDYEYLINKFNLVERRNKKEFDEVWLVNVDPIATYESIMVGKTAYWLNGTPIIENCENFRIMNVSISRPDTNFECYGHVAENIMSNVFKTTTSFYKKNEILVNKDTYANLNLWEKFTLNENANKEKTTGLNGPGNVHFSPNSINDYDWTNYDEKVISKWREWEKYPNLTNNPGNEVFSPDEYIKVKLTGTESAARKHHRWWFRLMPHVTGYTTDGYSNNWWDYIYLGDYVTNISPSKYNYTYNVNDFVNNIEIQNTYMSEKIENFVLDKYENNMIFSNKSIFSIDEKGNIIATAKGASTLKYYRDGTYVTFNIKVE